MFGNISLKALNGEGESRKEEYRRLTENMLPQADVAFLDEIWKASPAILNTLLTIINERKFHNGSRVENVPLKALLAASNELPAKGRGLEALYDRFIVRLMVGYIADDNSFFNMIDDAGVVDFAPTQELKALQISNDELKKWKQERDKVTLPQEVRSVITAIRKELTVRNSHLTEDELQQGEQFEVSDRRWKKIAVILKTAAFLNGRTEVDLTDCQLIEHCIWSTERQQKLAAEIVLKCIEQNGYGCDTAIDEIEMQISEFNQFITDNFYESTQTESEEIEMSDGNRAIKLKKPGVINGYMPIFYISKNDKMVYDANRNLIKGLILGSKVFSGKEVKLTITYNYHSAVLQCILEENGEKTAIKNSFKDKQYLKYQQNIADEIRIKIAEMLEKEYGKVCEFIKNNKQQLSSHLFVSEDISYAVMRGAEHSKQQIEDAIVSLERVCKRYQDI